jgi:two-component system OmpR family sensor kinase
MSIELLKINDKKLISRIKLSANRISNIYEDLCYLLKQELNEHTIVKNLNLAEILKENISIFETYAEIKKIEIIHDINNFNFSMDQESASRLINNLLSNALKYSKPNNMIFIDLKNNSLVIRDEGIGINQENLKHIHKRYYRANNSEGGFGIGLDIVNNICQKYKIKFNIESIENQGTIVTLIF